MKTISNVLFCQQFTFFVAVIPVISYLVFNYIINVRSDGDDGVIGKNTKIYDIIYYDLLLNAGWIVL